MIGFGELCRGSSVVWPTFARWDRWYAGIAFAAQAGCRMTAEIGSMRIAEEIDAVEAMGLRPIPFVVGTRFLGGMLIVIPGYVFTLLMSFFISNAMIKVVYSQRLAVHTTITSSNSCPLPISRIRP